MKQVAKRVFAFLLTLSMLLSLITAPGLATVSYADTETDTVATAAESNGAFDNNTTIPAGEYVIAIALA